MMGHYVMEIEPPSGLSLISCSQCWIAAQCEAVWAANDRVDAQEKEIRGSAHSRKSKTVYKLEN